MSPKIVMGSTGSLWDLPLNKPPTVSIVRSENYQPDMLEKRISRALEPLGGLGSFVKPGIRVVVKPNLLSAKGPERAITTHPEFVAAVVRMVQALGARVVVGDSPAGAKTGIQRVWDNTGLSTVAERDQFELVCFESAGVKPANVGDRTYYVSAPVMEADLVINLPKLKTHVLTLMTGAVKNNFGVIPGFRKGMYHKEAPNPRHFARILVDIFSLVHPGLSIMDGIDCMEGDGPASGSLRHLGLVLASADAVALDTVVAEIIGLEPGKVDTIRYASDAGLGVGDIGAIEVAGEKIEDLRPTGFKLPSNTGLELLPKFLVRLIDPLLWLRPKVTHDDCILCGECSKSCPTEAMRQADKGSHPYLVKELCINCWCCHEICPSKAIIIDKSWLAKRFIR